MNKDKLVKVIPFKSFINNTEKSTLFLKSGKRLQEALAEYIGYSRVAGPKDLTLIIDVIKQQKIAINAEKEEHTRLAYQSSRALEVLKRYDLLKQIEENEKNINEALRQVIEVANAIKNSN